MARFEIQGKEYELKLDFKALTEVDKLYNSPLEFVGKVLGGSLDAFVDVVYFGLMHSDKGFARKTVLKEIEQAINDKKMNFTDVLKIGKEVVTESFFFKETVQKMMKNNPQAMEQLSMLTE